MSSSNSIEGKHPKHWKSTAAVPYYTEKFGRMLKPYLDAIWEDHTKFVTFDCQKLRMSVATCYLRAYQGWLWLLDNDDPEGKYRILKASCVLKKGRSTVTLEYGKEQKFKPLIGDIQGGSVLSDWKEQLLRYVEDSENGVVPLEIKGIIMNRADQEWLEEFLSSVDTMVATISITDTSFKVCKNSQLAALVKARRESGAIQ